MKSCTLSGDFKSLEKVCQHVAGHHRNDKDVLYDWPRIALKCIPAIQSITLGTWKVVMDITGLIYAQSNYVDTFLVRRYASVLAARNEDPVPVLERLAEWDDWFYTYTYPTVLKPHVVKITLDKITKNHRFAEMMAVKLFEDGEIGIKKFAETFKPRKENSSMSLFQAMWKDSENRDIIRRWFKEMPLTGRLIDWFWRKDPVLFKSNMQRVVESLIGEEQMTWFERDHRLLAFFELTVENRKPTQPRDRSPMPAVLTSAVTQRIFMITTVASYETASEFLKAHCDELTCPLAARWSLRFAWRQFRDLPRDANWDLLKEMSYRCDAHSVRRVLGMVDAPADWMGHVSRLVWERTSTEAKEWKEMFLKSIPSDRIALVDPGVRVQLLDVADPCQDIQFIVQCWRLSPDDTHQIGTFFDKTNFEDLFVEAVMKLAIEDNEVGILEKAVGFKLRPKCVFQLMFLKVFLTTELNSFPGLVLNIFEGKDELVCLPLMADALMHVIKVTKVSLFWFIRNLVGGSSRVGFVLGVYLLPERVHLSGRFVNDPDAQVYEDIVEILKGCQDRVVDVYLYKHFNNKIAV